jgi:CHASE3 domain sensor protein
MSNWFERALDNPEHPVWDIITQITKTFCILILAAGVVGAFSYWQASNFDETEYKVIGGSALTLTALLKITESVWNRFSS